MAYYLYQMSYSRDAMKAMVQSPSDRRAAAKGLVESLGGTLHDFFFSFGPYDIVCIIEVESDSAMAALSATVSASGAASAAMSTRLFTADEAMEAMRRAAQAAATYRPPMA